MRLFNVIQRTNRYSLLTLLIGCFIVHLYLHSIDVHPIAIEFLYMGVLVQSASLVWLLSPILGGTRQKISPLLFITFVLILSLSMSYNTVTRFGAVYGSDSQREFKDASVIVENGKWDPNITPPGYLAPAYKYTNVLSITIFPMIISEVTTLGVQSLFVFVVPMIIGLLPLFAFVTIRRFMGDSPITYVATAMMPLIFFNYVLLDLYRSAITMPSLLLLLYFLAGRKPKDAFIFTFLGFSVASGHYTLAYYTTIMVLLFVLVPLLFSKVFPKSVKARALKIPIKPLLAFFMVQLLWLVYISTAVFSHHLQQSFNLINELLTFVVQRRSEIGYVMGSPKGLVTTGWLDLQFVLIAIGGLIGLFMCVKGRTKNREEYSWTLTCCALILFVFVVALTTLSVYLQVERILCYFLFLYSSALAISLVWIGRYRFKVTKLLVVIFLFLMLPMNMLLVNNANDPRYHPITQLSSMVQANTYAGHLVSAEGKAVASMMQYYLAISPDFMEGALPGYHREFVTLDTVGLETSMWNTLSTQTFLRVSYPTFRIPGSDPPTYANNLLLHNFFMKDGLWISTQEMAEVAYEVTGTYNFYPALNITSASLTNEPGNNMVYNNFGFVLMHRK